MRRIFPTVRNVLGLTIWGGIAAVVLMGLQRPFAGVAPLGTLLDPADGLYRTARNSEHPVHDEVLISGLGAPVTVERDERGVPHIFAESDRDAVMALGFVVAQDRLFQLDFLPRAAAGRLSEIFGSASLETDRFLRQTGMDWAARRNVQAMASDAGIEYDLLRWFAMGANAYMDGLDPADLPFEFRLFGYEPDRYAPLQAMRLMQYFAYDLAWSNGASEYAVLLQRLGKQSFDQLYPRYSTRSVPIVPGSEAAFAKDVAMGTAPMPAVGLLDRPRLLDIAEGFRAGKGSNNWVVTGARSATGAPILAGDMHLSLSLPAIWYETHLVTPEMNTYGVLPPGTPLPVEAFNDRIGWTFTNTGVDVLDHYAVELDAAGRRYRHNGAWRAVTFAADTIRVRGAAAVVDTLRYTHYGPVLATDSGHVALRWAAHARNHTLTALWGMNRAQNLEQFEAALRYWGVPAQNILYADVDGNIAIRSTGNIPVRKGGHGVGVLDGVSDAAAWVGQIPFEELPMARNPAQEYLASANQEPTSPQYPYYLGHDWGPAYRALRINALLSGKASHSVEDMQRYQSDVHAMQRDLFVPLLDTLSGLEARAQTLRDLLAAWSGNTATDRNEPLAFYIFLRELDRMAWDEPIFADVTTPNEVILLDLLTDDPTSVWLDVVETQETEDAAGLLRLALTTAADTLEIRYGADPNAWRWGKHHKIEFRHVTQTPALRALWRGPYEYPGFEATLSPGADLTTTHSASWRVIVDFSHRPPTGYGVYPGGQSGAPFSRYYDMHVARYVDFSYYPLQKPDRPQAIEAVTSRLRLVP